MSELLCVVDHDFRKMARVPEKKAAFIKPIEQKRESDI